MFYAILAIIVAVAMLLIFHDDHDRSYNRNEKRRETPRSVQASRPQPEQPAPASNSQWPDRKYYTVKRTLSWNYLHTLHYDDSLPEETMESEIAGLGHYVTGDDMGPVNGTVRPEPDNAHDPRAQAVVRADGKKLGYIPRRDLDDYGEFNPDNLVCPFSGEILMSEDGFFTAYVTIALPASVEFVKGELSGYLEEDDA